MSATSGSFGYKIGRKVRLMKVHGHADLLWKILIRETYVLLQHFGSIDALKNAFFELKDAKNKPKLSDIEKCKIFTDLNISNVSMNDWSSLTRFCQHSFINILESGVILNNGKLNDAYVFLIDFNTNCVRFYGVDYKEKETEYEKATIEEILTFEDMPTSTLTDIVNEMREKFEMYSLKKEKIEKQIENIQGIIQKTHELGSEQNILDGANKMKDDLNWEKKKLDIHYRVFFNRLKALDLFE
jgi:hypothetical protein